MSLHIDIAYLVNRSFTQRQAKSIGLTGFVSNAPDGTVCFHNPQRSMAHGFVDTHSTQVRGEAQGSEDRIKEFIQHLNNGPPAASVSGVEHNDISSKGGESGFNVK